MKTSECASELSAKLIEESSESCAPEKQLYKQQTPQLNNNTNNTSNKFYPFTRCAPWQWVALHNATQHSEAVR